MGLRERVFHSARRDVKMEKWRKSTMKKKQKKTERKNMMLGTQSMESAEWRGRRSRENIRVADKT